MELKILPENNFNSVILDYGGKYKNNYWIPNNWFKFKYLLIMIYIIFIYRNPIKAILSRMLNIDITCSGKLINFNDVLTKKEDLIELEDYFDKYVYS